MNLDAKLNEAKQRIAQAPTYDAATADIAAVFESLNDSHAFFVPPGHSIKQEYGWRYQMIGNRCLVTRVKPRSDAEAKGVKPGDQVLTLEGFEPTRDSIVRLQYALDDLMPMRSLTVDLLDPMRKMREVQLKAQLQPAKEIADMTDMTGEEQWRMRLEREKEWHLLRVRYKEFGDDLLIVKLPEFVEAQFEIHELISRARKHKTLVLDLRGSPGGSEETLQYLLGGLFDKKIKIADRITRTGTKPLETKSDRHDVFAGNLIVLVDSGSASASELLARTVQIQKRGTVLGDHTAGATMEAVYHPHQTGSNPAYYFGASITEADLVLPDGKSLERVGVTPDVVFLPSSDDLAHGRDPAMSHAAALANVALSPTDAGKLFPYEWPGN